MKTLYIFFGMIASGKSTLAQAFAAKHHMPYYNTDEVRKQLAGVTANTRCNDDWGKGIYSPAFTRKTYDAMLDFSINDLRSDHNGAVLDGSYLDPEERKKVRQKAKTAGISFIFVYCHCPEDVVKKRLAIRAADKTAVSDGRWDIFLIQQKHFTLPVELQDKELWSIDTDRPVPELLQILEKKLPPQ